MDAKTPSEALAPDAVEMTEKLLRVMEGVNAHIFRCYGNKVMTGPFTGMIIPERSPWVDGNASCKVIGTYEHELHKAIEYALWRDPKIIVNVGCAEGYYAVGFGMKGIEVLAFDLREDCLDVCREYAERNNVHNITLEIGATSPEGMGVRTEKNCLYFLDCEGDECELVNLERCPILRKADIVVECHDFLKPGTGRILADRLERTHHIELIRPALPDLRFLEKMPTAMGILAVVEKRPMPCYWLACWAKERGASNG